MEETRPHAEHRETGTRGPGPWLPELAGRLFQLVALATFLCVGWGQEARAQATVMRGEVTGFFVMPFSEVPDDPEVLVFAYLLLDGQMVFAPGGTAHLKAHSVKEIEWSRVSGEAFRYELADIQMRTTNTDNLRGQVTGSAHLKVTLIRIHRATSLPIAVLTGEGRVHVSASLDPEREHGVAVEDITWTVSPLP